MIEAKRKSERKWHQHEKWLQRKTNTKYADRIKIFTLAPMPSKDLKFVYDFAFTSVEYLTLYCLCLMTKTCTVESGFY